MIKVSHLRKEFELSRQQQKELNTSDKIALAVNDVSFECQAGKVYSLLGPNGAGKTTTLRMLSTILTPTSGDIEIAGIDAVKYPREARAKIGFLTVSTCLYARLTPI
jgi:sodium transport system ATP-binding protein